MVREGRVFTSVATDPDFGANYYVTAYEVGAQVTTGGTVNSVVVRAGHGFAALDKFIVSSSGVISTSQFKTVLSVDATHIVLTGAETVDVSTGDFLINLGQDSGSATPLYNGNGLAIYTDMAYGSQAANNTVQCDANGRYRYYYNSIPIWELVRSSLTTPFTVYLDTGISGVGGPSSSTDNAVVRWDGTGGVATQDSVVTIGDTGATTGISTLGVSGTATMAAINASGLITGTLGATISGGTTTTAALSATTIAASGLVAAAAAVTVGTTLTVSQGTTLTTTLSVGQAATLTGGIAGGIPRNVGTWTYNATTDGTAKTPVIGAGTSERYVGSIFVPTNMTVTGIQYLRGSGAVGTVKVIISLHSSTGAVLANSAAAGTAISAVNTVNRIPFTTPYAATGPQHCFIGIIFDTATADTFRTIPTACDGGTGVVGSAITGQTFGTPATFAGSVPTTFTGAVVPIASLY